MGLVWKVCEPDELIAEARSYAEILASRPIPSLMAVKQIHRRTHPSGDRGGNRSGKRAFR